MTKVARKQSKSTQISDTVTANLGTTIEVPSSGTETATARGRKSIQDKLQAEDEFVRALDAEEDSKPEGERIDREQRERIKALKERAREDYEADELEQVQKAEKISITHYQDDPNCRPFLLTSDERVGEGFVNLAIECFILRPDKFPSWSHEALEQASAESEYSWQLAKVALAQYRKVGTAAPPEVLRELMVAGVKDQEGYADRIKDIDRQIERLRPYDARHIPHILERLHAFCIHTLQERALDNFKFSMEEHKAKPNASTRKSLNEALAEVRKRLDTERLGLIHLVNREDFAKEEIPETPEVFKGLLRQGKVLMFAAGSKSKKTWVSMHAAHAVAAGKPWLGFETNPGKVLYLNLELDASDFQKRDECLQRHHAWDLGRNLVLANMRESLLLQADPVWAERLIEELDYYAPVDAFSLIVVDPFYVFGAGAVENSAEQMLKVMMSFGKLAAQTGAAVWLTHHFSKGSPHEKAFMDRGSGSGVMARFVDAYMTLTPPARKQGEIEQPLNRFVLEVAQRSFEDIEPCVVDWEFPVMSPQLDIEPEDLQVDARLTYDSFNLVKPLMEAEEPLDRKEWYFEVQQLTRSRSKPKGISTSAFYSRVERLVADGHVEEIEGEGGVKTYRVTERGEKLFYGEKS